MKIKSVLVPLLAIGVLTLFYRGPAVYAAANTGGHDASGYAGRDEAPGSAKKLMLAEREREEGEEGEKGGEKERFTAPESPFYKKECSSCHFLYQPGLLPARSWSMLINISDKHFGRTWRSTTRQKETSWATSPPTRRRSRMSNGR